MAKRQSNTFLFICMATIVAMLVGVTVYAPWWPRLAIEIILLYLFCPNYNLLSTSCRTGSLASYILPWSVFLAIAGLTGVGIRKL